MADRKRIPEEKWTFILPDDIEFTLHQDGMWVFMRCSGCARPVIAGNGLELWDFLGKAQDHYEKNHAEDKDTGVS